MQKLEIDQKCQTCRHWLISSDLQEGTCKIAEPSITTSMDFTCSDWECFVDLETESHLLVRLFLAARRGAISYGAGLATGVATGIPTELINSFVIEKIRGAIATKKSSRNDDYVVICWSVAKLSHVNFAKAIGTVVRRYFSEFLDEKRIQSCGSMYGISGDENGSLFDMNMMVLLRHEDSSIISEDLRNIIYSFGFVSSLSRTNGNGIGGNAEWHEYSITMTGDMESANV